MNVMKTYDKKTLRKLNKSVRKMKKRKRLTMRKAHDTC